MGVPPPLARLRADTSPHPHVTDQMIARYAKRLWELHGGNAVLNWLEAERALEDLVAHAAPPGAACTPEPTVGGQR